MSIQIIKTYTFPFDINLIKKDCLGKSGVYLILNNLNGDSYIGSARSSSSRHNRLYIRFRNHFFNSEKSTNIYLRRSIEKYGKQHFSFNIILFDEPQKILDLETFYIQKYKPVFNFLQFGSGSIGYKHSEETKLKMKSNYSEERRLKISYLNKNRKITESTRELMKQAAQTRTKTEINTKFKLSRSKPTSIFNINGEFVKGFNSAKEVSVYLKTDYRTIRRHIKSEKPLKNGLIIKYSL